jgi:hypothetical protein
MDLADAVALLPAFGCLVPLPTRIYIEGSGWRSGPRDVQRNLERVVGALDMHTRIRALRLSLTPAARPCGHVLSRLRNLEQLRLSDIESSRDLPDFAALSRLTVISLEFDSEYDEDPVEDLGHLTSLKGLRLIQDCSAAWQVRLP